MPCPDCGKAASHVIDSRLHDSCYQGGERIKGPVRRRRHICTICKQRFTTYEMIYKPKPSEIEEFVSKIVHYRKAFGIESEPGHDVYEAMAATA